MPKPCQMCIEHDAIKGERLCVRCKLKQYKAMIADGYFTDTKIRTYTDTKGKANDPRQLDPLYHPWLNDPTGPMDPAGMSDELWGFGPDSDASE